MYPCGFRVEALHPSILLRTAVVSEEDTFDQVPSPSKKLCRPLDVSPCDGKGGDITCTFRTAAALVFTWRSQIKEHKPSQVSTAGLLPGPYPGHSGECMSLSPISRTQRESRRNVAPVGEGELYKGTLLIRKRPPPRTTIGPYAQAYCRVLRGGVFLWTRHPCTVGSDLLAEFGSK